MAPRVHVANFQTLHQRPLAGLKTVMLRFSVAALKLPFYFCSVPVRSVMGAVFGSIESGKATLPGVRICPAGVQLRERNKEKVVATMRGPLPMTREECIRYLEWASHEKICLSCWLEIIGQYLDRQSYKELSNISKDCRCEIDD